MAYTQAQIDALRAAIATGALTARNANGEFVTFRSLGEMCQALAIMEADLAGTARPRRATGFYPRFTRLPCDPTG